MARGKRDFCEGEGAFAEDWLKTVIVMKFLCTAVWESNIGAETQEEKKGEGEATEYRVGESSFCGCKNKGGFYRVLKGCFLHSFFCKKGFYGF